MELLHFEGIEDAHLVIKDTVFEDRAKYVCNATNKYYTYPSSKDNTVEIQLRIKGIKKFYLFILLSIIDFFQTSWLHYGHFWVLLLKLLY